jgi:hypothetical protein
MADDELTDAAKAEIAAAIAIVREDRIDKLLRERLATPKEPVPQNPPVPPSPTPNNPPVPPTPNPTPPPTNNPPGPTPPNPEPTPKKRGLYWGDRLDD